MTTLTWQQTSSRLAQFLALTKPRVVSLIVFCAVIGMFLAVPFGVLDMRFAAKALAATIGVALLRGQCADDVAYACHLRLLRDRLHRRAEADDAPEHRDRRRLGRDAAGAGLGCGDRRYFLPGAAAVPDHFRLDAAAFLGARALSQARVCEGRRADAAGDAWGQVHAAARAALHRHIVRGDAAAIRYAHEWADLPPRRGRA